MRRSWLSTLFRKVPAERRPSQAELAAHRLEAEKARVRTARKATLDAFRIALERGDTRKQHDLAKPAVRTTCAELAAEIGRSPSQWVR